jgi:DNA-binding transcriptional LysR family regulator
MLLTADSPHLEPHRVRPDLPLQRLRLDLIETFVVVADELNCARAASCLDVSASGIAKRLHRLEQMLGCRLLHRTTRSVTLTPAGEALLPEARRLLVSSRLLLEQVHAAAPVGEHAESGAES